VAKKKLKVTDQLIRKLLVKIESDASDLLGDVGCSLIDFARDRIESEFSLSKSELEKVSSRLAVGVVFELEQFGSARNTILEYFSMNPNPKDLIKKTDKVSPVRPSVGRRGKRRE
jgi:hypothetical protein